MIDRKDYTSSCKITLKTDRQDHRMGNSGLKGPPEVSSLISLQAGSATRSAWLLRSLSGLVLKTFKAGECRNSLSIHFKVLGCPHNEEVFIYIWSEPLRFKLFVVSLLLTNASPWKSVFVFLLVAFWVLKAPPALTRFLQPHPLQCSSFLIILVTLHWRTQTCWSMSYIQVWKLAAIF